jgi:Zn finger protein HypA/HybF involved in hydrogenase expression
MHEMGIASSILEAVRKELLLYPQYRAAKVQIRIGEFAGVDQDSLRFCFEAIVKDSSFAPLELGIEASFGDELDLSFIEMDDGEKEIEKETEAGTLV